MVFAQVVLETIHFLIFKIKYVQDAQLDIFSLRPLILVNKFRELVVQVVDMKALMVYAFADQVNPIGMVRIVLVVIFHRTLILMIKNAKTVFLDIILLVNSAPLQTVLLLILSILKKSNVSVLGIIHYKRMEHVGLVKKTLSSIQKLKHVLPVQKIR